MRIGSARPADGPLRLTPRQEAFWLEDALFPHTPCNHVVVRLEVAGELDEARFAAAFAAVVAANDAFQLAFDPAGGPQLQPVRAAPKLTTAAAADDATAARWRSAFLRPRFGPGEPLWRAALLRRGPQRSEFVLAQHHVVTDSSSCLAIVAQLAHAYAGTAPVQGPATLAAAMAAQRRWLETPAAAAAAAFWRERLADAPPPCRLYGRDPARKTGATRRATAALSMAATQALAARAHGGTPAQWFAAATFAWLHRIGEGDQFVLGVPLRNREPAQAHTVGLLMEVVHNRVAMAPSTTMRALLADVQAEVARVQPHRRWTVPSRQARCDVLLNVHAEAPTTFAGLPCRYELTTPPNLAAPGEDADDPGPWSAREAVTVQVHRHGHGPYEVSLDANCGLFDAELAARAVGHLTALLEAGLRDPDLRIGAAAIVAADEAQRASPRRPAAVAGAPPTVAASFLATVRRGPERIAVRHRERAVTCRELADESASIAGALRAAGVGEGDRVGVCLRRSPTLLAALLACARLGAAYVPLDPGHPAARLQLVLTDASLRALLVDGDGRGALASAAAPLVDLDAPLAGAPLSADEDRSRPDAVAYVLFTSGSTGRPKGVEVLHRGLGAFLAAMASEPGCGPDDRVLAVTTVAFDIAALELFLPLAVGAEVVLADRADAADPAALARLVAAHDVTVLQATPATYRLLLQDGWPGRPGLRALVGGEALAADLAAALRARTGELWNMYGPTETTVWSTCVRVDARAPVAIGRPIAGAAASVRTPLGAVCPLGAIGELWLGGDGVAKGYLGRPELTAERFVDAPDGRWYRTGDLARLADDGLFEFLGRTDFQVKVRGHRIELGEIEAALAAHPAVEQAVAVVRGEGADARLVGYAQCRTSPPLAELDAWLRARLPAYMVPAQLVAVARLPLTPSGKIDRKALPEPAAAPADVAAAAAAGPPAAAPIADRIAAQWRRVLGAGDGRTRPFALDDDFFAVGGHSLAALELAHALQDQFGVATDAGVVFAQPTLRQQAAFVAAGGEAPATSVVTLTAGDAARTPIYMLCGISLYAPLARALSPQRACHALFVPDERFDGSAGAAVDKLAAAYWSRIAAHHRGGPLHLAGFCYGGMIAFEVAQLARAAGVEVGALAMIDTALWGVMRRNRPQQIWRRLQRTLARAAAPGQLAPMAQPAADARAGELYERARAYRPTRPFDGRCLLVRALGGDLLATWRATPFLGWEPWLAGPRELAAIDAAHDALLQPPAVAEVAARLSALP